MKTLAELACEYLWLIMLADEDVIDLRYSVKCQESLPSYFSALSLQEKAALSEVAKLTQARLLAKPDKDGYIQRSLVSEEQKEFLSALASGELFDQWT